MDRIKVETVYDLLSTIGEALEYLQQTGDENICQDISGGRIQVIKLLEDALGCSLQNRIDVENLPDDEWLVTAYRIMDEIEHPFQVRNSFDREFMNLMDYIWNTDKKVLLNSMKSVLSQWRQKDRNLYKGFVSYFSRFPLWGTLNPDQGDFNTLELRVNVLKQHSYDFLWLYRRLGDYLSKRTLCAILKNWAVLDIAYLSKIKSIFPDYYEPDIFPDNRGDVFVDVGAFIGDSIIQYVQSYGTGYKRIYAYEISSDSCEALRKNTAGLHDLVIRRKGVGRQAGEMYVESSSDDASANKLNDEGKVEERVEIVTLDEDVEDTITFLKMDIEGAEQDALLGCQETIKKHHPKLAICVYHGYEDLWKIPFMIDCMYPGYKFYLRHNGGNLIPTEFVLLCRAD